MAFHVRPWEQWKRDYPGKWADAQRAATEVYGIQAGTPDHEAKARELFVALGAGCVNR